MKTVCLFLFVIITVNCFSQEENEESNPDSKKILIGISFSPDYSSRRLSGTSVAKQLIDSRNNEESSKIGYTGGLNLIIRIKDNIGIGTGILFSNKGYQSERSNLIFGDALDLRSNNGFIYSTSFQPGMKSAKITYNDYYIDIPSKIMFSFG